MILAIVNNDVVTAVIMTQDDSSYGQYAQNAQAAIDVTNLTPWPQVGWIFTGNQLLPPSVSSSGKITKLAMLQRFTVPERLATLTYVEANPSSVPAILMQNIMVATYVDLNRADTQAGINYLVYAGLITQDRAVQILTTAPSALEIYTG
jgi:hypothetical protein